MCYIVWQWHDTQLIHAQLNFLWVMGHRLGSPSPPSNSTPTRDMVAVSALTFQVGDTRVVDFRVGSDAELKQKETARQFRSNSRRQSSMLLGMTRAGVSGIRESERL